LATPAETSRHPAPAVLTIVVGTGYLGRRVLESATRGTAIGLSRSADPTLETLETYDLDSGGPLPLSLPERYRVLYTVPPAQTAASDVRLERLLAALEPPPVAFVYVSTTGVYGDRGGEAVDEQTAVAPGTARAERRVAAERLLDSWCRERGVRLAVLRVPGIYGPGRLGVERLRAGMPVIREAEANPGNRIHVDDLVSCCRAALELEAARGVFNVGDGDPRSSTWFVREVARQSGLPLPPEISRAEAERVFSPQRLAFVSEARRVDTRRMREVLGVTPRYASAEDGIRASLTEE
jgi:nucleoside-diphosphate-sugar epimerase